MKKILTLGFAAALVVGAAFALHAQGSGFHHMGGHMEHMGGHMEHMGGPEGMAQMMEHVSKALSLTDTQKAAAKKLHEETFAKAGPLMEQHHQQMEEIHVLLDGDNPDATEIGQKMIAAHATGEQLKALHEAAMAKFSALLNADQLEKFKKFQEMHHDGGPGGPEL
jgi:Spy/CpxP family protein refolding chaperone